MAAEAQSFQVHEPTTGLASRCEPILRGLPDWFGIESAIVHYVEAIESLPTLMVTSGADDIGFLSLKIRGPESADAYVLGILEQWHRQGVGRAMFTEGEAWLATQGVRFLQVKTVDPARECEHYAVSRRFYESIGFTKLETFPTLWDEANPCLQLIKCLEAQPMPAGDQ